MIWSLRNTVQVGNSCTALQFKAIYDMVEVSTTSAKTLTDLYQGEDESDMLKLVKEQLWWC